MSVEISVVKFGKEISYKIWKRAFNEVSPHVVSPQKVSIIFQYVTLAKTYSLLVQVYNLTQNRMYLVNMYNQLSTTVENLI